MFIIVLGAVVPIILDEFLQHHHTRPQQHDVICGFLEQLVWFHSLFFGGVRSRNEVLQSLKLLRQFLRLFVALFMVGGVNCGDEILVSPSWCSCSLCGSFEREFVTVPCGCGHGNRTKKKGSGFGLGNFVIVLCFFFVTVLVMREEGFWV